MGYTLHAFIAQSGTFDDYKKLGERVTVAPINESFDLLLNDVYLDQALGMDIYAPSPDPEGLEHWLLSTKLIDLFREKSKIITIAYVKVDFFGGVGSQQALVWHEGKEVLRRKTDILPRPHSYGPVNEALKILGVIAEDSIDEFETVGLHRTQQMEQWFEKGTGIHWRKYLEEF